MGYADLRTARDRSTSSRLGKRASESPSSSFEKNAVTKAVAAERPLLSPATGSKRLWPGEHFVGDRAQNCGYGCVHVHPGWTSEVPYVIECLQLMGSRFRVAD